MNAGNSNKTLILLFLFTYSVSYITRINLSAVISEIAASKEFSENILSIAVTGSCITYGIGQIISGISGDLFSPKKLVSMGLTVTAFMNILIPSVSSPLQLIFVWSVNGFSQAFMWPPIVRLMVVHFKGDEYKKAAVTISWASSLGTVIIYFVSPILIMLSGWKSVFIFSSLCGFVMLFFWKKICVDVDVKTNVSANELKTDNGRVLLTPVMLGVILAIILQGMLRDGVTTWMPSYISETYNIGTEISILTGVILPLFSVVCTYAASVLYLKKLKNPLFCSFFAFALGIIASVLIFLSTGKNAVISVLSSALLTGLMHIISSMLTAMVPQFFRNHKKVSTISGVLNASAYAGSAISTYAIAHLSRIFGWKFTTLTWIMIALSGTVLCLVLIRPFEKKHINQKGNLC